MSTMRKFLSQIITDEELDRIKPGAFNILAAPRGWGKTTFMFDDRILKLARDNKHIIYLIHNKNSRDALAASRPDMARAFVDKDLNGWFAHRQSKMWTSEEDVNYIQVMCYQTFAALIRRDVEWLQDIDLIVWDEFDDIQQYYEEEIRKAKRQFPDLDDTRIASLLQEGKHTSITAFIYLIQTYILEPKRIILLAISATPEAAAPLFSDYVNYILKGKLQEIYDAKNTFYIESIAAYVSSGVITPQSNICPWVFTNRITDILRMKELFQSVGFNVFVFWSFDNPDWKHLVTDEMRSGVEYIYSRKMVPEQYNCVITNQAAGRMLDIYDQRFQDWFCNSTSYSDMGQFIRARYEPNNKYLLNDARGLVEFVRADDHFPACYYIWHGSKELKELLKEYPIYTRDYNKQLTTWSAVQKEWGADFEFVDRKYGAKHLKQYRIVGRKSSLSTT